MISEFICQRKMLKNVSFPTENCGRLSFEEFPKTKLFSINSVTTIVAGTESFIQIFLEKFKYFFIKRG
jgi:hypothetical protein